MISQKVKACKREKNSGLRKFCLDNINYDKLILA